jgi:hypothetical protein
MWLCLLARYRFSYFDLICFWMLGYWTEQSKWAWWGLLPWLFMSAALHHAAFKQKNHPKNFNKEKL